MKLTKKRILVLSDWYIPAVNAGGPVRSVSAIVSALKSEFDISVLTSDRDFGDSKPFSEIKTNVWLKKEEYRLKYISPDVLQKTIKAEINQNYDKIYLNSLFSIHFTLFPLWAIESVKKPNVIIAPRGMLGKGALGLKSFKKKSFIQIAKAIRLFKEVTWHASTHLESKEILDVFPNANVVALENLSSCKPEGYVESNKQKGKLKLVFISRISIKKNLLYLLEMLNSLDESNIYLDIYGPIEDKEYWTECSTAIESNSQICYKGVIQPHDLHKVLIKYDLFVLPTLNENFGHIILEALNSSLPLLLSNQTPWLKLKELGVGVDIPLTNETIWKQTLLHFLHMETHEYQRIRRTAWEYGQKKLDQQYLIKEYIKLFS